MQLLVDALTSVTLVLLVVAGFGALEVLIRPGATLQTFYGLSRIPAPLTEVLILSAVCIATAVGDLVVGKLTAR